MRRKAKKKISVLLFLILAAGIAFVVGWKEKNKPIAAFKTVEQKKEVTYEEIESQIFKMGELNTAKFIYTDLAKYEKNRTLFGKNVPLTKKTCTITYDGTIKAGIDVSKIKIEITNYVIKITIPQAKIMSHEVDMNSVSVVDENDSLFNAMKTKDITDLLDGRESMMEDKAIKKGLLDEANENAVSSLRSTFTVFLKSDNYLSYSLQIYQEKK